MKETSNIADFRKCRKILYLGMADDIQFPISLFPDLEILYIIDLYDNGLYRSTLTKQERETDRYQKDSIINFLKFGSDEKTTSYTHFKNCIDPNLKINYLNENDYLKPDPKYSCEILEEKQIDDKWILKFIQNDKEKQIIRYTQNFKTQIWPEEIKRLDVIIGKGSFAPLTKDNLKRGWNKDEYDVDFMIKMFNERTNKQFYYTSIIFGHTNLPLCYNWEPFNYDETLFSLIKCENSEEIFKD